MATAGPPDGRQSLPSACCRGESRDRGHFFRLGTEGWPPSSSRCAPNHFGGARSPARLCHPPGPHAPPACPPARRLPCRVTRRPRTDPTAASAPPAKRPRDSEGSHQLKVGRKRHTTVPSRAFYTARRRPRRGALRRTCFKPQDGGAERDSGLHARAWLLRELGGRACSTRAARAHHCTRR